MKKFFLGLCWLLIGIQWAAAQHEKVEISEAPVWTTRVDPGIKEVPATSGTGGTYYLLVDYQDHVERQEEYIHYAIKIQNNEGLQNSSDIQVDFDPAYQSLTFHEVSIYRGGRRINKLDTDHIKTFRKEDNADRYLYDGSIRVVINLSDVRVGDVIEYSYTRKGFNPLYEGRYFASYHLKMGFPFDEMQVRILASKNRKLNFRYLNGAKKPAVTGKGEYVEYRWVSSNKTPLLYDNNTPGWYDPYPYISVSSFDSWADVVDWALPHYSVSSTELKTLRQKLGDRLTGSEEEKIMQAIRFVQDKVRYLGFEGGMSAYKPHDPVSVLKRRFGDCKDKSVLLAAILQAEGIASYPMLVNSSETKAIAERLPSPRAFDHCVVKITHEGRVLFIDPTISNQGGSLDNLHFPNYQKGLVLKRGEKELNDLPVSKESRVSARETFDIKEIGGAATFEVVTEYYGDRADYQRSFFNSYSLEEITKDYVSFYANAFPSITAVKNVEFIDEDRDGSNKVVVKELYEIPELWQSPSEGAGNITAEFYPLVLQTYLSTSISADRKTPLYIGGPTSYIHETILKLPESWSVTESRQEIEGAGFRYLSEVTAKTEHEIKLDYEYHLLEASLPVGDIAEFASAQNEIENTMVFSLYYNTALGGFQFSWISLLLFLSATVVSIAIARHFYLNFDPEPEYSGQGRELGGWLYLVVLGIALAPIVMAFDLFVNSSDMFNHGIWTALLATGEPTYNPELALLIVFENFYNAFIIVFSVLLLVLLIQRRSSAPKMAIVYLVITLVMQFLDTLMATTLVDEAFSQAETREYYGEVFRSFISTCIWVPYFFMSKRVKETFVNTLAEKRETVPAGEVAAESTMV